jgi:hypothetical protein
MFRERAGKVMSHPGLLLQNALHQGHWAFSNKIIYRRESVPTTEVQRDQVKVSHTQVSTKLQDITRRKK